MGCWLRLLGTRREDEVSERIELLLMVWIDDFRDQLPSSSSSDDS